MNPLTGLADAWTLHCPRCGTDYVVRVAIATWIDFTCEVCHWTGQVRFYPTSTEAKETDHGDQGAP